MDDDMNTGELLVKEAKENQTRVIFDMLKESSDLSDAIAKVKALLSQMK